MKNAFLALPLALLGLVSGCATETPTSAVVHNGFADSADPAERRVVVQVWYATTYFGDPVLPGGESDPQRTIPTDDVVYALVATGWDPSASPAPDVHSLRPMRSSGTLGVSRGDTLALTISADLEGDCEAGKPLSQTDADVLTQRIFPGPFVGFTYDAATCHVMTAPDAGP